MIQLSKICKAYPGGYEALRSISFEIDAGEMVFLTGHSGAGKSTLLKLIAAIERPNSGSIIVKGQNIGLIKGGALPYLRRNFGLIFQDHKLLFDRSVFDNVMLPLQICGFDYRESAKRVRAALDKVGLLKREKASPIALSGGEQQRVAIARAFATKPRILFADEPTGNLDNATGKVIIELLFKMNAEANTTLVLVTHDMQLASRCQRQLQLDNGVLTALV